MSSFESLDNLIDRFQSQKPIRASSLVITVYGDAVEPHGGTVWLGSLIRLLEPMGINERLMRTTIFRLTQDDWLMSEKVGRRSYYSLTGIGRRKFEQAFKRVYNSTSSAWNGRWCLVLLSQLSAEKRKLVRDELAWQGFGPLSNILLGSPRCQYGEAMAALAGLGVADDVMVFETVPQEELSSRPIRLQVRESWGIEELGQQYEDFILLFRPVWQEFREVSWLDPQSCFLARTLLIHEYRKLILRDPLLPDELLPGDWNGRAARQLCRNIYRLLTPKAEEWLAEVLETADGPLPDASDAFFQRFGGMR